MAGNNSIQFLRGTSAQRATHTETSLAGQPIYETNTNKLYIGDGTHQVDELESIHTPLYRVSILPSGYAEAAGDVLSDGYRNGSMYSASGRLALVISSKRSELPVGSLIILGDYKGSNTYTTQLVSSSPDGGETVYVPSSTVVKTGDEWNEQNPVLLPGQFGYDTTNKITKIGDGTTAWANLYMFLTMQTPTFANSDWATIAELSKNGQAQKYFAVGDEKTIELTTGEQVTLVILGFNHDDLTSGGKAGITIGMKNLLATSYLMNNTNAGGWDESKMRTSTMATLLSQLPSDLQGVIKQVNKKATAGSQSTSITTSADKLWLLAMSEIFSATSIENSAIAIIADYADAYNAEGTQYKYYENLIGDNNGGTATNSLLIKKLSNGDSYVSDWWLRSPSIISSLTAWSITNKGSVFGSYTNKTHGVSFGFCV